MNQKYREDYEEGASSMKGSCKRKVCADYIIFIQLFLECLPYSVCPLSLVSLQYLSLLIAA